MSRILLTGGSGLIGQRLVELAPPALEILTVGRRAPRGRCAWIETDLGGAWSEATLPAGVETVVHLAQSRRYREFPAAAADLFAVNVASTQRLLEWARTRGVRRFVLASSGGVYGRGPEPFAEDTPLPAGGAPNAYLAGKLAAELLAHSYRGCFDVIVLRPFFVYGPAQDPEMLLPRIVAAVAAGRPVRLEGAAGMRCNPLHVDDAARALLGCLALTESTTVNLAGPEVWSLREIAGRAGALLGRPPRFESGTPAASPDLIGATGRMRQLLGAPRVGLDEGISELVAERPELQR